MSSSLIFTIFSIHIVNILCKSKCIKILPPAFPHTHFLGNISLESPHLSTPVWTGCSLCHSGISLFCFPSWSTCVLCLVFSFPPYCYMPSFCTRCSSFIVSRERGDGILCVCVCICSVASQCALCGPRDHSPPGSIHEISPARILECLGMLSSGGSSD